MVAERPDLRGRQGQPDRPALPEQLVRERRGRLGLLGRPVARPERLVQRAQQGSPVPLAERQERRERRVLVEDSEPPARQARGPQERRERLDRPGRREEQPGQLERLAGLERSERPVPLALPVGLERREPQGQLEPVGLHSTLRQSTAVH